MSQSGTASDGRNWAVAIVHGVGVAEPVDMLNRVTEAIKSARPGLTVEAETTISHPDPAHIQHERRGQLPGGGRVRFATAHWSNIAGFGDGVLDALGGILVSGFGVRFLADARPMGRHNSADTLLAIPLRANLKLMIYTAAVFLPLTMFSLIFSCMGLLAFYVFHQPYTHFQVPFIIVASLLAAAFVTYIGRRSMWDWRNEHRLAMPIFNMVSGFAVLGAGSMAAGTYLDDKLHGPIPTAIVGLMQRWAVLSGNQYWAEQVARLDETAIYFGLFQQLQYFVGFFLVALTGIALVLLILHALLCNWKRTRSLGLATVSVVSLWVVLLLLLWPENLLTHSAMTQYHNEAPVPSSFHLFKLDTSAPTTEQLSNAFPLLWFDLAVIAFLVLAVGLTFVLLTIRFGWQTWPTSFQPAHFAPESGARIPRKSSFPRLIVTWGYTILVLLLMLTVSVVGFTAPIFPQFKQELGIDGDLVKISVIIGIILFVVVASQVRLAAKLMLDVVNHFAAREKNYPVRQKIGARLDHALDHLLRDGDKPHLVIVAHSQGTVITLDRVLGGIDHEGLWSARPDGWAEALSDRVSSLTILTFGSPISHVYQRYFPTVYIDLCDVDAVAKAAKDPRVSWFNTYRIDDYIGTYIENSVPNFPVNVPMPIGGHTRYWEPEIFQGLFNQPGMQKVLV